MQLWSKKWRYLSSWQISKRITCFHQWKTQASLRSKCMSNKKNKFVYHVYHEKHKKSLHMACKNQTKDKRKQIAPMSNKMNTHKKCIPWIYLFIFYSYFAPLKYIHPISPKHNNFMDISSSISPPLLSNAFMIISMRLEPNPSTTPINTNQKRYLGPTIHHICMDTYSWLVLIGSNFIIRKNYELGKLYGLDNLGVHKFN